MADLELAEFIEKLRGELETAIVQGDDREVRFVADKIDLELKIAAERSADAKGRHFLSRFSASGPKRAEAAKPQTRSPRQFECHCLWWAAMASDV